MVYTADEVWLLWDLQARDPQMFSEKLRALHQVKMALGVTFEPCDVTMRWSESPVPSRTPSPCWHQWEAGPTDNTVVCWHCGCAAPGVLC